MKMSLKVMMLFTSFLVFLACEDTVSANGADPAEKSSGQQTTPDTDKELEPSIDDGDIMVPPTDSSSKNLDEVVVAPDTSVVDKEDETAEPGGDSDKDDVVEPENPNGIFLCIDGKFNTELISENQIMRAFKVIRSSGNNEPYSLENQGSTLYIDFMDPSLFEGLEPNDFDPQTMAVSTIGYIVQNGDIMEGIEAISVKSNNGVESLQVDGAYGVSEYDLCESDFPAGALGNDGVLTFRSTVE